MARHILLILWLNSGSNGNTIFHIYNFQDGPPILLIMVTELTFSKFTHQLCYQYVNSVTFLPNNRCISLSIHTIPAPRMLVWNEASMMIYFVQKLFLSIYRFLSKDSNRVDVYQNICQLCYHRKNHSAEPRINIPLFSKAPKHNYGSNSPVHVNFLRQTSIIILKTSLIRW